MTTGPQLALQIDTPQPSPGRRRYEPPWFYHMVRELRLQGFRVYRRGASHSIDGRQVSTRELRRFYYECEGPL